MTPAALIDTLAAFQVRSVTGTTPAVIRILVLSDGRPGHFNLSYGIAAAIGRLQPTTVNEQSVRRGRWPGGVLAGLAASRVPAAALLKFVYGIEEREIPGCDVIVSAGAETLAANVWLARARRVPNIFYGSLRLFRPQDFSLVLTSYEDQARRPRHALALKPSRLDPDTLPAGTGRRHGRGAASPATAGLILGGNSGTFVYSPADWDSLLALAEGLTRAYGTRWIVSNSRRTPDLVSERISRAMASGTPAYGRFIDVRQAGAGGLVEMFAAVDAVICTDDSSSMISECIWARLPVLGVRPVKAGFDAYEQRYRDWLQAKGVYRCMQLAGLTPEQSMRAFSDLAPLTGNPLDDLASLLAERIPRLLPG